MIRRLPRRWPEFAEPGAGIERPRRQGELIRPSPGQIPVIADPSPLRSWQRSRQHGIRVGQLFLLLAVVAVAFWVFRERFHQTVVIQIDSCSIKPRAEWRDLVVSWTWQWPSRWQGRQQRYILSHLPPTLQSIRVQPGERVQLAVRIRGGWLAARDRPDSSLWHRLFDPDEVLLTDKLYENWSHAGRSGLERAMASMVD